MPSRNFIRSFNVLFITLGIVLFAPSCTEQVEETLPVHTAPKVILIIGDGMDDQQITIARNYLVGSGGRLTLDQMPVRAAVQIQAVDEDNPEMPLYSSDSANTATSMATGAVTSPTRIATTAGSDERLQTIMEMAMAAGMGTGLVTTSSLTDATPAAFIAHINQRGCQGPSQMIGVRRIGTWEIKTNCSQYLKARGGPGSISEQLVASGIDVMLGGGLADFDQPAEGDSSLSVIDEAIENGYRVIRQRVDTEGKVLGLFSPGTMPVLWRGVDNAAARPLEKIEGKVQLPDPFSCEPNPQFLGMPTLVEMATLALDRLDASKSFMLMIESASIDKQSHARRPCGSIGELLQLNQVLDLVLEYASSHPETLILVTADHAHAAQIVGSEGGLLPLNFASPGYFARLQTREGGIMGINYATNDSPIVEYHTGAQVPLYASGPGADSIPTYMLQEEIFGIMTRHLGLDKK